MGVLYSSPFDLLELPDLPGIYKFYDKNGQVIYIGKAKNIKKRVQDYFINSKSHHIKTQRMVMHIVSVDYTVVNSEYEALLLEKNLIKELQPRYNILLRDDKTYPYLCITNERFPRLVIARATAPVLGKYYGPFTSSNAIKQTLAVVKKLFPFRSCAYNLSEISILKKKFKVCLDYHLGHCKGPCQALQSESDYLQDIQHIEALLDNNFFVVKKFFKQKMLLAAQTLDYKQAHFFKGKLDILDSYQAKSLITTPLLGDLDVVAMIIDEKYIFVGYLHIKQGIVCFTQNRVFSKKLDEPLSDLVPLIICELRSCSHSVASEVCINMPLHVHMDWLTISMPKIGDKRKLVELALQNALFCKKDFLYKQSDRKRNVPITLLKLQQDLKLKQLPSIIECFDNSNIQGHCPVSAMVCFKNGQPSKKDYRHYTIKTVVGSDDFASMYEVLKRRYSRLVEEKAILPNLIVVDGGKGQLNAAVDALKQVGIYGKVALISIAKRLEEIYFPYDQVPLFLDKKSVALKFLQRIRNEAHRFAIAFHRKQRLKLALNDDWLNIPGIGPKTLHKLWKYFGTPKMVQSSSLDQLAAVIGRSKASVLLDYLKNKPFKEPVGFSDTIN